MEDDLDRIQSPVSVQCVEDTEYQELDLERKPHGGPIVIVTHIGRAAAQHKLRLPLWPFCWQEFSGGFIS
jgi:hypothetical protein